MSDSSSIDSNYINNLISRVSELKQEVLDGVELQPLTGIQRDLVVGVLDLLEYGLVAYGESNYGCCQEVCEVKTEYDPPGGYKTEDDLKKVAILTTISNLGINKVPSSSKIKTWWHSVDNRMVRALSDEYPAKLVNWLFDFFGLEEADNPNFHEIVYGVFSFLLYVVFGDPIIHLNGENFSGDEDSVDAILDSLVQDVLGSELDWKRWLQKQNLELTKSIGAGRSHQIEEVWIEEESVYSLFHWLVSKFLPAVNQVEPNEESALMFGEKMPNYPSGLWVIVNVILAGGFSFLIGGARAKHGKTNAGELRWVPPIGFSDDDRPYFEDDRWYDGEENDHLNSQFYERWDSPFRGFAVKSAYYDEYNIVVEFTQEVWDSDFDELHPSIKDFNSYRIIQDDDLVEVTAINAHSSDRTKAVLSVAGVSSWTSTLKLIVGRTDPVAFGSLAQVPLYNNSKEVDPASFAELPVAASDEHIRGRTFSDVVVWASRTGQQDSSNYFADFVKLSFEYLIDWHRRKLTPELHEAYNILQSLGWMNLKGSNFAGFLHPDAACGAVVEDILCEYYNNLEDDCVKVEIENSCGVFDCEELPENEIRKQLEETYEGLAWAEKEMAASKANQASLTENIEKESKSKAAATTERDAAQSYLNQITQDGTQTPDTQKAVVDGLGADYKRLSEELDNRENLTTAEIKTKLEERAQIGNARKEAEELLEFLQRESDKSNATIAEKDEEIAARSAKIEQLQAALKATNTYLEKVASQASKLATKMAELTAMLESILTGSWSDQCDGETTIITRDPISSAGDVLGTNNCDEAGLLFARNVQQTLSQAEAMESIAAHEAKLETFKVEYAKVAERAEAEAADCAKEREELEDSLESVTAAIATLSSFYGGSA